MKLGILGTGMIVKDILRIFHLLPLESVYILGTPATLEETRELCEQYHLNGYFLDYDELLDSDIDTVYVALPNFLHYSFADKALMRQKHVIIEKPGATNTRELAQLRQIAKERRLIILEAMNIHYLPAYQEIKRNLPRIGEPKIVTFNYSQYSSRYSAFQSGQILPAFDPATAGGALMDLNVYNIHAIVGLFGRPSDMRYYANVDRGIDTSGVLLLDYGTFKAVSIGAKDCRAPVVSTLQGNQGCIRIEKPINQVTRFELIDNQGNREEFADDAPEHRLLYEFQAFIRIIDTLDFACAEEKMSISVIVSEIMERARKQEKIVFANDEL